MSPGWAIWAHYLGLTVTCNLQLLHKVTANLQLNARLFTAPCIVLVRKVHPSCVSAQNKWQSQLPRVMSASSAIATQISNSHLNQCLSVASDNRPKACAFPAHTSLCWSNWLIFWMIFRDPGCNTCRQRLGLANCSAWLCPLYSTLRGEPHANTAFN